MRERYVVINGSINGKELTVSTKKNPERKLQTETHTVIGKAAGDFQNQQKIQKNDREQRLAGIYYNQGRSFSNCQAYGYRELYPEASHIELFPVHVSFSKAVYSQP
mgnify:CR=1 FL=1